MYFNLCVLCAYVFIANLQQIAYFQYLIFYFSFWYNILLTIIA